MLLAWLTAALAVPAWRYRIVRSFLHTKPGISQTRAWAHRMAATTLADGLVWGIAGYAFLNPQAMPPQLLLLGMLVGIPAGSIFINSWWPPSLYFYAIPSLGLTALGLLRQATPPHAAIAGGLIVYLAIIYQIMRQAHAAAHESIKLRFENLDLIAQLRREKNLAEEANRAKSKFLAAASHDLRQPLHALGLFAAALDERIRHPSVRNLVENINRSVDALEDLFDGLLDISRLDSGVITPQIRDVALAPLLERLENEYVSQARAKGLVWHASISDSVVRTDPLMIERILRNLLSNAIRYTERGEVRLTCTTGDDSLLIEVADTGIGIAPEHQSEVFNEFVQLDNPERDRRKGVGLGLAIVQRMVRLLDHPLEMRSQPGTGTRFYLTLPLDQIDSADTGAKKPADGQLRHQTLVLVIDDEADVREAMQTLLDEWGYTVVAVANASEAVACLAGRKPTAIVADYRLRSGQTGLDAIALLRSTIGAEIPALLVSGDTHPQRKTEAQQNNIAFLHKPLAPARLRAFLRSAQAGNH